MIHNLVISSSYTFTFPLEIMTKLTYQHWFSILLLMNEHFVTKLKLRGIYSTTQTLQTTPDCLSGCILLSHMIARQPT